MATMAETYRTARLAELSAIERYRTARLGLLNAVSKARGSSKDDADELVEAYERLWQPDWVQAQGAWTGNDQARREYDALMRAGVDPRLIQDFSEALAGYRTRTAQARVMAETIRSQDGAERRMAIDIEADELLAINQEIRTAAQAINPEVTLELTGIDRQGETAFDPVRGIVAISVAPGEVFDPREAGYRALWQSIEDRLAPKERALLLATVKERHGAGLSVSQTPEGWELRSGTTVLERMTAARASNPEQAHAALFEAHASRQGLIAQEFARHLSPDARRDKSHALSPVFDKVERFLDRVRNMAGGRGWQTPEDVFDKAHAGKLASRQIEGAGGLRVHDPRRDPANHRAHRDAVRAMTDTDLRRAIRDQDLAVARQRRRSFGLGALGAALTRKVDERREALSDLQRGRALLLSEMRERASRRLTGVAPPVPGERAVRDAPVPSEPGASAVVVPFATRAAGPSAAPPSPSAAGAERYGTWDIRPSADPALPFTVTLTSGGAERTMAQASTSADAGEYIQAFEAARIARGNALPAGAVGPMLAEQANQAGVAHNADIAAIRGSGLLDPHLDTLLSQRAMKALVYPLKDGSLVYMTPGGWQAGTLEQFQQAAEITRAMTGRTALSEAAAMLAANSAAATERDRGTPATAVPTPAAPPPPAAANRPAAAPVEPAPARAASYSTGRDPAQTQSDTQAVGKPFKITGGAIDTARTAMLAGWTAEQLRDTAMATRSALAHSVRSHMTPMERLMLTEGRKALDAALRDKGIHPQSVFATTAGSVLDPERDAKSARPRASRSSGAAER